MSVLERDEQGWTVGTLKEYVERRFQEQEKAVQAALAAAKEAVQAALVSAKEAVDKAEKNVEKWREASNEWRGAMDDRERNFATARDLEALKLRLDEVRDSVNKVADLARGGRGQRDDMRTWLLAAGSGIIVLIALWRVFKGQ